MIPCLVRIAWLTASRPSGVGRIGHRLHEWRVAVAGEVREEAHRLVSAGVRGHYVRAIRRLVKTLAGGVHHFFLAAHLRAVRALDDIADYRTGVTVRLR